MQWTEPAGKLLGGSRTGTVPARPLIGLTLGGYVPRFSITPEYDGDCQLAEGTRIGQIYHVVRNAAGGSLCTPVAHFFVWRPVFIEGYNAYWRVDCFVGDHALAPPPGEIGEALAHALMRAKLCDEPLWVSWYQSRELGGKEFGEVFEREE